MPHLDLMLARQFVRNTLDEDARLRCEVHLRSCAECRQLVDEVRKIGALLRLGSDEHVPACDVDRLVARIQAFAGGQAARRSRLTLAVGCLASMLAGAAAGVAAAAYWTGVTRPQTTTLDPAAAHAAELATLATDPWIIDGYAFVLTFDQLLAEREP